MKTRPIDAKVVNLATVLEKADNPQGDAEELLLQVTLRVTGIGMFNIFTPLEDYLNALDANTFPSNTNLSSSLFPTLETLKAFVQPRANEAQKLTIVSAQITRHYLQAKARSGAVTHRWTGIAMERALTGNYRDVVASLVDERDGGLIALRLHVEKGSASLQYVNLDQPKLSEVTSTVELSYRLKDMRPPAARRVQGLTVQVESLPDMAGRECFAKELLKSEEAPAWFTRYDPTTHRYTGLYTHRKEALGTVISIPTCGRICDGAGQDLPNWSPDPRALNGKHLTMLLVHFADFDDAYYVGIDLGARALWLSAVHET